MGYVQGYAGAEKNDSAYEEGPSERLS